MTSPPRFGPHLHPGLVTHDADRARGFYAYVMGLDESAPVALPGGGTRFRFRAGRQTLSLCALPNPPERQPSGLYDGLGYRVLAFFVDDLDALCERILTWGGRVAPGLDLPGKLRIRFAKDADGNMLELLGLGVPAGPALADRIQVGLTVADAERSRAFYGGGLGWPEHPTQPMPDAMTRYAFSAGSSTLKFWSRLEPLPNLAGPPLDAVGIRFVTIGVPDIEAACSALEARGVTIRRPARGLAAPAAIWIADPDGNWIELSESEA